MGEKTNLSDSICNKDITEENIIPTLHLWESVGVIAAVSVILFLLIMIVRLKQVIYLFEENPNIYPFIKVVDGKRKRNHFSNPRVKKSFIDFLPDYESVLKMDEEATGLPSYRTAVGEDINS